MYISNENSAYLSSATYNKMLLAIRKAFESANNIQITLQQAISSAKDEMVNLGLLNESAAHQISEYIKHDINEAAEDMMESNEEFCDWLMLDIDIVERKVVDMFLSVADTTRLEIEQFNGTNSSLSIYNVGEITGFGTLQCTQCGSSISFTRTSVIRSCNQCDNTKFVRDDKKNPY